MTHFVYVTCMGAVYRLTERNYEKMLREWMETGGADVGALGTEVGAMLNITDMSQEGAVMELDAHNHRKSLRTKRGK